MLLFAPSRMVRSYDLAPESSDSPHGFGPSSPIIPTKGLGRLLRKAALLIS